MKKIACFILFVSLLVLGPYLILLDSPKIIGHVDKAVYIKKTKQGNVLYRNGNPFYIKGAGGQPLLKELLEAGGNTLRLYDTVNLKHILKEAEKYNIAVIVDIPFPKFNASYNPYSQASFNSKLNQDIIQFVKTYKNYPAILFWNIGNEIKYPFVFRKNGFIRTFNGIIDSIHKEDPDHLVGTSISGTSKRQTFSLHWHSPQLDIIGFNVFGNLKDVKGVLNKTQLIASPKPYYYSEWGIHGPWEEVKNRWAALVELNSSEKAEIYKKLYYKYIEADHKAMGSLAFYWGNKVEGTPTWFNIFDADNRTSEIYYVLKMLWKKEANQNLLPPKVDSLLLEGRLSNDLQVYQPNHIAKANLFLKSSCEDPLRYEWSLSKEGWGNQKWKTNTTDFNSKLILSKGEKEIVFKMPEDDGPYRLFVNIYDMHNNFSTVNVPFYILKNK